MKKAAIALASVLFLSTFAQQALAGGCYTAKEVEAEQGLRIHSELMVIGLTCLKMPGGHEVYAKYARFTQKNQTLIAGYEEDLISYYRSQGAGGGSELKLHTLRTNLANGISRHAIQMSTLTFCQHFIPRIDTALAMDNATLRRWARHVWADTPVSQPVCARLER